MEHLIYVSNYRIYPKRKRIKIVIKLFKRPGPLRRLSLREITLNFAPASKTALTLLGFLGFKTQLWGMKFVMSDVFIISFWVNFLAYPFDIYWVIVSLHLFYSTVFLFNLFSNETNIFSANSLFIGNFGLSVFHNNPISYFLFFHVAVVFKIFLAHVLSLVNIFGLFFDSIP